MPAREIESVDLLAGLKLDGSFGIDVGVIVSLVLIS